VYVTEQCPPMSNPCSFKNGGCTFLCLPNGRGGRTCACPDGKEPHECHDFESPERSYGLSSY